jgi:hypothetical protein
MSILIAAALTLAVGGWIVQGVRAPFRAAGQPELKGV